MPRRKRKRRRTGARRAAEQQQLQEGQQRAQSDEEEEDEVGDSGVDVEAEAEAEEASGMKRRRGEEESDEEGEGALGTEEEEEDDDDGAEEVLSRTSDDDDGEEEGEAEQQQKEEEEEAAEAEAAAPSEQGPPPAHSLRAWFPPPEGGEEEGGGGVYIGLQPGEALAVVGSALLRVAQGRAEALGYEMIGPTPTPIPLHSPKWLSALVLRALPSPAAAPLPTNINNTTKTDNPLLASCPTVLYFLPFPASPSLPRFLTAAADAESSLLSAPGARGLPGRVEPEAVVRIPGCLFMGEATLTDRLGLRPLAVPASWQAGAEEVLALARQPPTLQNGPVVAVCGGKGTGKSTLTRYLTHRLLSDESGRVLYLDLDLGQPETSPPGLVSLSLIRGPLLGPPHTHMASAHGDGAAVVTTLRSYFLGDVTTRHEPGMYSAALHELLALHKADPQLKGLPLLVNMDGWVRGLGLELLTLALAALQPDLILRIEGKQRGAQFALIPPQGSRVVDVAAPGGEEEAATAAADSNEAERAEGNGRRRERQPKGKGGGASAPDLRTLRLVAYFLSSCAAATADASSGVEEPFAGAVVTRNGAILDPKARVVGALVAQPPYRVPWSHVSLAVLHEPVALHETLRAMDASIVGVLALPSAEGQEQGQAPHHPPVTVEEDGGELAGLRVYGPFSATPDTLPPPAPLAPCLGLGILRGVDRTRRCLHLLTPLSLEALRAHQILLARGALQLPLVALYNPTGHAAPYLSSELTSAEGASQLRNRAGIARR